VLVRVTTDLEALLEQTRLEDWSDVDSALRPSPRTPATAASARRARTSGCG
jgi:hypothetical protein